MKGTANRWFDWEPPGGASGGHPDGKLTKLTKLTKLPSGGAYLLDLTRNPTDKTDKTSPDDGFVSFVSPLPSQFQKIRVPQAGSLDGPETELTKLTKPSSVSFVSPLSGQFQKMRGEPDPAELAAATALLHQAGVRLMRLEGGDTVGVWSDLDSPAIRNALLTLGSGELPILYIDGPSVPLRYKLRRVPGEPVPNDVREAMERSKQPWKIRNRSKCRFIPWSTGELIQKPHTVDPKTGIWPMTEWTASCGRGFVSLERFARPGDKVIPRTNRGVTRKWRKLNG